MKRRRDVINTAHLVVALGILIAVVCGAYYLLGLPAWLAVVAGAPVAYVVSSSVSRRLLPLPPPLTDQERLYMTSARRWLVLDIFIVALLHFGGGVLWVLSFGITAVITFVFVFIEWRKRKQARLRLQRVKPDSSQ